MSKPMSASSSTIRTRAGRSIGFMDTPREFLLTGDSGTRETGTKIYSLQLKHKYSLNGRSILWFLEFFQTLTGLHAANGRETIPYRDRRGTESAPRRGSP